MTAPLPTPDAPSPDRPRRPRRTFGSLLLELLGSMNLAITLLVVVAVASVVGTVLKQNEPYTNYVIKFGPFWFEVFRLLGLDDVYGAPWFLAILAFLLASTSVCIYRNAPGMLREMGHFRTEVQLKSLRAFHNRAQWALPGGERERVLATLLAALRAQGYRTRVVEQADHTLVAAMKGAVNRLGYLFTHLAVVVICLGALFDGNLFLKLKEWSGDVRLETRDLPARDYGPASRLVPGATPSFRGSVMLPEGSVANFVFVRLRDGAFVQELPFAVELKAFRVEHYATGQPKNFESDVLIHDRQHLAEPMAATIRVNHPLVYRGYAIYQSDFGDGGSLLKLKAWPLAGQRAEPPALEGRVGEKLALQTPQGPRTLEIDDFRLFNILPVPESEQGDTPEKKVRNFGPSFTFRLRDAAGQALEYQNFMAPMRLGGRDYFLTGVRGSPAEDFRYLHIPADAALSPARFLRFVNLLQQSQRRDALLDERSAAGAEPVPAEIREVRRRLVALFAEGGVDAVIGRARSVVPAERLEEATRLYLDILRSSLGELYLAVLAEEGVKVDQGIGPTEERFFNDALNALAVLPAYGAPFYLQLTGFEQVQASGLQITKSSGQNVVYFGFALLIAGVFLMFYSSHRRLWSRVAPTPDGLLDVLVAGTGNRHQGEFEREFDTLRAGLARHFGPASGPHDH
ncbi:cytochrome c biogenesis protein [Plasticicumulans lactativorans]|uniref:Cytochrome c biogenesis protein n=1 Tax=Plasticicumulans lactativorans TaxID=1133106 RepID=A0A4R2LHN3_9GAMM|nr:cytochrome c biogenesis protein ResB [Plasticicumulans lactativorans]TCO82631.1 cytochrome c biogenesis protein [Plasticicumulans lactativorans]